MGTGRGEVQDAKINLSLVQCVLGNFFLAPCPTSTTLCKLSCKYVHSLLSSPQLPPDLGLRSPFSAEDQPLGSLACYYSVLNGPDLCNIFYLPAALSLNSLL